MLHRTCVKTYPLPSTKFLIFYFTQQIVIFPQVSFVVLSPAFEYILWNMFQRTIYQDNFQRETKLIIQQKMLNEAAQVEKRDIYSILRCFEPTKTIIFT